MTAKGYAYLFLSLLALGVTIAASLVTYRAGTTLVEAIKAQEWLQWTAALCGIVPAAVLGAVAWYVIGSLAFRLQSKKVAIERARAKVNDFTPTERGFAPRLIGGKVVNPNVAPSAITPLDATERPEEIPEERRLASVMGWHLSNAPGQQRLMKRRAALPIPEPKPSPWKASHVERLLLEAGETQEDN